MRGAENILYLYLIVQLNNIMPFILMNNLCIILIERCL